MEIVRFAPSPTNQNEDLEQRGLHIGGLRTALFNYIIKNQDKDSLIIMRCEDTDEERSNDQCLKCIVRDFDWAGIKFDAGFKIVDDKVVEFNNTNRNFGPLRQSQRKDIYHKYAKKLLEEGKAYMKDGATFFKMPKEDVSYNDLVLGEVLLPAKSCEDFVIIKSSGIASFYFAMTIDDYEMGTTMIIRGFEHVNTAFRQIALQKALGLPSIKLSHIPLIFNPDGTKMSKRQKVGQVNVHDFRKDGYLPEVVLGYISGLGWSSKIEMPSLQQMVDTFKIGDIGKSNARFDYKKLLSFNSQAIQKMDMDKFMSLMNKFGHEFYPNIMKKFTPELFRRFCEIYKDRAKTLKEPFDNCKYLFEDLHTESKLKIKNELQKEQVETLKHLFNKFENINEWTQVNIITSLNDFVANSGISMGKIAQPLRTALTGNTVSPPIDKVMDILGKKVIIRRLQEILDGTLQNV